MAKKDLKGAVGSAPIIDSQGEEVKKLTKGKYIVIHPFVCKNDANVKYEVGDYVDNFEKYRLSDVIQKGLVEEVK